jgi:hypothetical protein
MEWIKKFPALFVQFLLASMFLWGLNGITFFTLLSLRGAPSYGKGSTDSLFDLLLPIISAVCNGLMLTVVANLAANRFRKKARAVGPYLLVAGILLGLSPFLNNVVFAWIGPLLLGKGVLHLRFEWLDLPYCFNAALVGLVLFYLITRERKRTLKISEQEYQMMQLQQRQTKAELEALQARINPHFLYNALNSIASLVHEDPDRAERMVILLSRFFRYSTGGHNGPFDTVRQELNLVETYLEVENVRFGERLEYRILMTGTELETLPIPRFLLQPLVENSIKHGIARNTGKGLIEIKIDRQGNDLYIAVHDNGPAFPEGFSMGYGLKSIEEKLRLLYGSAATLEVANGSRKEVCIRLPASGKQAFTFPVPAMSSTY